MLAFRHASRRFGELEALRELDLELRPGERVALVGGNGVGKSTALRLAAGVLLATGGEVRVLGEDPCARARIRARIGFLSHETFLDPDQAAGLQVEFESGSRSGGNPCPGTLREALGLEEVWEEPVGTLSRGFQRRVELACVLAGGPDLLLLDEPLAGLDREQRSGLAERVVELAPEAAVLLATHVPGELAGLWETLIPMDAGRAGEPVSRDSWLQEQGEKNHTQGVATPGAPS